MMVFLLESNDAFIGDQGARMEVVQVELIEKEMR